MSDLKLKKGHNIGIAGQPSRRISPSGPIRSVALIPSEFLYIKPRLLVKEGDRVKIGDPLFCDKNQPNIHWAAPGAGTVASILFGPRRVIDRITIDLDEEEQPLEFTPLTDEAIAKLQRSDVINRILDLNLWPMIRQRPFNRVANPAIVPKSIFISALSTAPLAGDPDFILDGQDTAFQAGLDILAKLTDGPVHLSIAKSAKCTALTKARGVQIHRISGPHPAGNVGVQIHHLDPLNLGQVIWTVNPQHVLMLGKAFLSGRFDPALVVTVGGPSITDPAYVQTRLGAAVDSLLDTRLKPGPQRLISGDVLTGNMVMKTGYLRFYHTSLSCIPVSKERPFLSWLRPGNSRKTYTLTGTYLGRRNEAFNFTTLNNGGQRPMVPVNAWENLLPMDILPNPLYRAILANDLEEMEKLGLLELVEEDVALCSFACPSKIDLGAAVRQGLNLMVKES